MMWEGHNGTLLVAGHRGERYTSPENTLTAFKRAISYGVDMIETDIRMTKDLEMVIMHDERVDRTTDGQGLVKDLTLAQFKKLNAAHDFEDFAPEAPPTLRAFLELCAKHPSLLINFELKDYPIAGNEEFAFLSADKTIAMVEEFGLANRCVLNSFSAKLLEYIDEKYEKRYRLHGFYPYEIMDGVSRNPAEYLYCACLFPVVFNEKGEKKQYNFKVPYKSYFEKVIADGIIPWIGAGIDGKEELLKAIDYGAKLVTTDYPQDALTILGKEGLHE